MGIFDDAIREHLELKRHSGADEEELKELEDEAFGPPARPGEPDFPGTSEEAAVESGTETSGGLFDAEATDSDPTRVEESLTGTAGPETAEAEATGGEAVQADTPDEAVIEEPSDEQPALTAIGEEGSPETEEVPADAAPAPAGEEPETGEQPQAEGAEESQPADPVESSSFTTAEREAIADQPTVFFEQQAPEELELGDLDLDIDEEIEEVGGAVSERPGDEDPLIVEEAFSTPEGAAHVAEPPHEMEPEPEAPDQDEAGAEGEPEAGEPGTGDEDVLEETPEFLRDNPDDDELWFEQGEPKDFDF